MTDAADTTKEHRQAAVTHVINAPRHLVWKAWIEPEQFSHWFGAELDVPLATLDWNVKEGGTWSAIVKGQAGDDVPYGGTFRTVDEPELLALSFQDHAADGDHESQELSVKFTEVGDTDTEVLIKHSGEMDEASRLELEQGYGASMDRLATALAGR